VIRSHGFILQFGVVVVVIVDVVVFEGGVRKIGQKMEEIFRSIV